MKQAEDHSRASESAELWDPGTEGLTLYLYKDSHYYFPHEWYHFMAEN